MLLQALHAALATFFLLLAAAGTGFPLYRMLPERSYQRWERLALSLLGGWGLASFLLFLIGQIRFTRWIIFTMLAVWAGVGLRFVWELWREKPPLQIHVERRAWFPAGLVILLLVLTAIAGLAPVVGDWGSDTVAYHLLGPKAWLRTGVIRPVLDNSHTAFPQIAETMDAALLALGGPPAPCFADFVTLGLLLAMCGSLAVRSGLDSTGAWWVAVAAMPAVFEGAHGAFVDALFAAFFLGAARVALSAETPGEWTVCGTLCGLLIATKYTGLLAVPILATGVIFLRRARMKADEPPGLGLGWAGLATLLIAAPYYLRNWVLLGCPIYPPPPGLAEVCHAKYFSTQAILNFHRYISERGAGMGRGPLAFFLLPFNLTYHTANFHGAGGIGLVPLGLAPLGIYAWRNTLATRFLVAVALLLTAAWFLTQQESRFLIHVYAISAVLGVHGWSYARKIAGNLGRCLAIALVGISLLYGWYMIAGGLADPLRAVVSPQYSALRQERGIPYFESFVYLNREGSVKKVLILDQSIPPFYLDKDYLKPVGQWGELTMPGVTSPPQALLKLQADGVTHVLDVRSEISGFQVPPAFAGLQLVFEAKDQRIYRVE